MTEEEAGGDLVRTNLVYIILTVIIFVGLYFFVSSKIDNAATWEDFYAKEISRVINVAEPGEVVRIDVSKATQLAFKSGINTEDIFSFDNKEGTLRVSLRPGSATSYDYFNDVIIFEPHIERAVDGDELNQLVFEVR